jgi:signal transduction histidine kinase
MAKSGREIPDATPPFLTKELIDLWIAMAEARQKEVVTALQIEVKDKLHAFDNGQLHIIHKVQKLAGDGEQDIGAVARIERQLTDYIAENRAASQRASTERHELSTQVTTALGRLDSLEEAEQRAKRVEAQVNRWKLIPAFTHNAWKIIGALLALMLAGGSVWSRFHPQPVVLTPQQMQEIRKSP